MEAILNTDFNNIQIASSILEATNTDSFETVTIYPDLDTLVSIAKCAKNEKHPVIHTFDSEKEQSVLQNEIETIYPDLNNYDSESKILPTKEGSSSLNDKFKCHICSCTFANELKYKIHLIKHQQSVHVDCNYCGKKIAYNRFVYHVMVHTGEKPHICSICGRGFRLKRDLRQHTFTHTGERPYPCDICGKKFADTSSRRKHFQIHTGEKPYSCEICQRSFTQISHLREHQVTHTKEKSHSCELCMKKFTTKSSMQRHMLTHNNTCEVCNCTFTTNNKLQKHRELHNTERPFSCPICLRRFRKRTDINTHMLIHSDEKNVICKICNEAFKSYRYLRVHYAGSHKGLGPPFRCNICLKGFFQEKSMKRHYAAHFSDSNKRVKCPLCSITFSCTESLKKHSNLKNCSILKCYECDNQFESKDDLVQHLKITHYLFSDSLIIPDVVDDSNVKISPQHSTEKDVEKNINYLSSFGNSNNLTDEKKPTIKNNKNELNSFSKKRKSESSRKSKLSAKARKNSKYVPTIVKVEVVSEASNSFSEHDNDSCSSDKYFLNLKA
ncbi:zinc finger protein 883-like [Parasteatoda tepidariorum]|uniref:zinc finger protein 883-like n=1 Tax=Parasteatoda tepidariorum TaxID=114398 RepID=UPI00077FD335|nr:zinc finger protein 883-like [Parasteatoda tepidariorum]